jgi:hypothetical protein
VALFNHLEEGGLTRHAADRTIKGLVVGCLVCEGVFISFIRRFSRAAADAPLLGGKVDSGDWRCIGPGWLI